MFTRQSVLALGTLVLVQCGGEPRSGGATAPAVPASSPDVCDVSTEKSSARSGSEARAGLAQAVRRRAEDLRAQFAALREAEARACDNVSSEDRDASPFAFVDDIESVETLCQRPSRFHEAIVWGAAFVLRGAPGKTEASLQRAADCHIARNAALPRGVRDALDPLAIGGVQVRVSALGESFLVLVHSTDAATGAEIRRRAMGLAQKLRR